MGGSYSGPSAAQIKAQRDHEDAMMKMQVQMQQEQMAMQKAMQQAQIDAAERQRVAAEQAAEQAAIQSQSTMAQQASQQNLQDISQKLYGQNTIQGLADQNAAKAYGKSLTAGAENMTGNFDFANTKQGALQQLGAVSGILPPTKSNLFSGTYGLNPAATTASSTLNKTGNENQKNQYMMPNTSGLTFGGK
jgi:hypothetical protein